MLIPFLKVDEAQRLVFGRIDEAPDRTGEVFDYATSKANFQKWSGEMSKASDGKSLGNVRAMHKAVAAGKLIQIDFDDTAKAVNVCAHIVDDDEWKKVVAGVYTGFSPGGNYAKRWKDGQYTRYTAAPSEISIVDRPCIPTATFTLIKADGSQETVMAKGLGEVSELANVLSSIQYITRWVTNEAIQEGDGSPIPGRLRDWLADGASIFADMASEEAKEAAKGVADLVSTIPAPAGQTMELADKTGDLAKAGARHSKADLDRLQVIHDHSVGMGAACAGPVKKADGTAQEDDSLIKADLVKVTGELELVKADLAKTVAENDELKKRVAEWEAQPQAGGPVLRPVPKEADSLVKTDTSAQSDETGTFQERLEKVQAMEPGPGKAEALRKLADTVTPQPRS